MKGFNALNGPSKGVYDPKQGVYGRKLLYPSWIDDLIALDQSHVIQTIFTSLRMNLGHLLTYVYEFMALEPILGGYGRKLSNEGFLSCLRSPNRLWLVLGFIPKLLVCLNGF